MIAPAQAVRDEVFLEQTRSICPVCKRVIDAEINARGGRIVMRKRCPDHGPFEALVYGDADMYLSQLRYNKPGTIPLRFQTEVRDGCPLDCGMCPDHKQHTCLGVIEVNSGCNLDCPICFAGSGHQPDGFSLTVEQVALEAGAARVEEAARLDARRTRKLGASRGAARARAMASGHRAHGTRARRGC